MDVSTAISQRSSVRAYKTTDVEEDKLKKVLEAARFSPSASNRQNWKFIVVKSKETKRKLAKAAFGQSFIGEAPVIMVACGTDSVDFDSIMKITTDNHQYPGIKIKAMFNGKPKWARNSKRWMQPSGYLR